MVLILAIGGIAAWWISRPRLSDREQIIQVIEAVRNGVERKNPRTVVSHISEDYSDPSGINYKEVRLLALRLLRATEKIKVNILNYEEPQIEGDTARMQLTVQVNVANGEQEITNSGGKISLTLRKEKKEWKVLRAAGWQQQVPGGYGLE